MLSVSRLEPLKNLETCLLAVRRLVQAGLFAGWRYVVVGEGSDRAFLEGIVRELELQAFVVFTGFVSEEQLQHYYRACLCLVATPFDEPFGLTCIEAALHRRPAIVSNHGGPAEIVLPGKTGLHVNPADPAAVADRLRSLILNRGLALQLGSAAYKQATTEFVIDRFAVRFEQSLLDTVRASGRAHGPTP